MLPDSVKTLDPHRVRSVQPLRPEHLAKTVEFQIALRMRDFPKMLARLEHGELIPKDELDAKYLPLPADYEAVVDWAKRQGLTITQTDPLRLGVFVKGTVAQVQTAMQTQFAEVTVPDGAYTSAVTAPSIPATLRTAVLGVNGLQPHIHPRHIANPQPLTADAPPFLVKEILGAYDATNLGFDGTGETMAILIDTFPEKTDLTSFWSHNGIPQSLSNVTDIQAVSGELDPVSGEETLDTEWSSGIASGAQIRIYATTDLSFPDLDKGLQRILSDLPGQPTMHELSISLGLGETEVSSSQKLTDAQYFANIANYGVSVFVASGDDGAVTDSVEQPSYYSSDPSVTGVGGTSLYLTGEGTVSSESGWNGSGGGISSFFMRPSWQVGNGVPSGSYRAVPDVACAANPNTGAYVYLQGTAQQIGGTSWATPTWAGFCALINEARTQAGLGPIGMLNPKIYPLLGSASFRDITAGNNNGYLAGPGYDLLTGLGTPLMSSLLPALTGAGSATPSVTSFSPSAGAINTNVTIYGLNLAHVTHVEFNGTPAPDFSINSNSIFATVPAGATTGPITLLTGSTTSSSATNFTVVPLPTNDNFANATAISGTAGSIMGTNLGATAQPGEPYDGGDTSGPWATVWWVWQAPANGTYTFNTEGSNFDTTEAVYTGAAVNQLTQVASNDDYGTGVASSVTFAAVSGSTYYISVDGYQGAEGAIDLNWEENVAIPVISDFSPQSGRAGTQVTINGADFSGVSSVLIGGAAAAFSGSDTQLTATVGTGAVTGPIEVTGPLGTGTSSANFLVVQPVPNDDFANATVINADQGEITGNNEGATKEPGEPDIAGNSGGASIWYEWTPSSPGPETFTTFGSSFNTLLGVYTGDNVAGLTLVASNDDYGNTVTSSVTFNADAGTHYFIAVDGNNGATGIVVLNWARDTSLPSINNINPTSGPVGTTVVITGNNFTGVSSVSIGTIPLAYTVVSDNEIDAVIPAGITSGPVFVGNLLGAVSSPESFTLTPAPPNDSFADRIPLTGAEVHVTGANVGASREPGEPDIAGNPGGSSVWWTWTPPASGQYAISTLGSNFDTLLGVFTGDSVSSLTEVAENDDDPAGGVTSYVNISATAGTPYQIVVDGLNGASGSIDLNIYPHQASLGLYTTGFEAKEGFVLGQPLIGQNGWLGMDSGGNGLFNQYDGMPGQQAYVGYNAPTNPGDFGVVAYQPVNYSPIDGNEPVVTFNVLMAINDSTNFNYDDFEWILTNSAGHPFFTIDFSNSNLVVNYSLDGSSTLIRTGVQFSNNVPMKLAVTMDYGQNEWSATLNGAPLVRNKPIRTGSDTFDFGAMRAKWLISPDDSVPGDNYMLFDNYSIVADQEPMPTITIQPQSQTVMQGNPAALTVVAAGQTPLYYQWMRNKTALPGAESPTLAFPSIQPANAGNYSVTVSNAVGLVSSQTAKLTVTPEQFAPAFTKEPPSLTVAAGSTAVLAASANGYPAPVYQWMFDGNPIPHATKPTLSLPHVQLANQGSYTLVASNAIGTGTSIPAVLTVGNSFAAERGNFNGMVFNGQGDLNGSGLLKITLGAGGSFTGTLSLAGKNYRLVGALNPEGTWQGAVGRSPGGLSVIVTLRLSLSGATQVTGSVVSGNFTGTVTALRDNYSKSGTVAPEQPAYTMELTSTDPGAPAGAGYAAITVDASGSVRAAGRLGDATPFAVSSLLSDSGAWPFFTAPYGTEGYAAGTLTFQNAGTIALDGTLHWTRPASSILGGYPAFSGNLTASGYVYKSPQPGQPEIPLTANHGTITFSSGILINPLIEQLSLAANGSPQLSGTLSLNLAVTRASGLFSGAVDVGLTKPVPYSGVLLQPINAGAGLFESPTVTGNVGIASP